MRSIDNIIKLIRPEIAAVGGYVASKAPETLEGQVEVPVEDIIKLDANENLYGCSPRVQHALASFSSINIYPDANQGELKKLLAGYAGVDPENIIAGNGSDQLIDMIMRLFIGIGDEVVNCAPTFDVFRHRAQLCGGIMVDVPRDENFAVDVRAVKAAITSKTKLIPLATPNNPTGTLMPKKDILEIVKTGLPVIVDEAYAEFSGETLSSLVSQYSNMIVLRTFSKWAGLAGLRIGYGIFPDEMVSYLMGLKAPYNVNAAAVVAVRESLKDLDYLMRNVKAIVKERDQLFTELRKFKFLKPFPSQANFIFCSVTKGNASVVQQKLENKGLLVRYFDIPLLRNAIRIGIGKPEHSVVLLKVLKEIEEQIYG